MPSDNSLSANPFFSIIVPCCDVAQYVRECLESVKRQGFAEWECIAVVEESKDDTERIVRDVVAGDERCRVITEPRSGSPAMPRNTGLDHAGGDYVVFLDGDDMLADDALSRIAGRIRERPGADIYPCAFNDWREGSGAVRTVDNWPPSAPAEMSGLESVARLYGESHTPFFGAQFTVYRRAFLDERSLRFVPGLVHEDLEFTPRVYCMARRVAPLHEPFYLYRMREDSIMGALRTEGPKLEHYARVFRSLFAFHAAVSKEPGFDPAVSRLLGRSWIAQLRSLWFGSSSVEFVPRRRRLDTMRQMFDGGFGDFRTLLSSASLSRRVAGWCMVLFVRVPILRWVVESFLSRIYGKIAWWRHVR